MGRKTHGTFPADDLLSDIPSARRDLPGLRDMLRGCGAGYPQYPEALSKRSRKARKIQCLRLFHGLSSKEYLYEKIGEICEKYLSAKNQKGEKFSLKEAIA